MFTVTGEIVTPKDVLHGGFLVVDDSGQIADVSTKRTAPARSADIDATGCWVLPGFVDLHVHGGGGADFMHGTVEAVRQAARTHARFGTTGLLATTLTASREDTDQAIRAVRSVMEGERHPEESQILGIHLEGPYLCAARRGAQPERFIRPPDLEELDHWITLSGNAVRQITLAPEQQGAQALIRDARAHGIIISIGHTNATAAQTEAAVGWGASQATHVFNAMPPVHHREPGAAGAALALPEIITEVIADGVHLHPLMVRLVLAAKGPDGAVLITDAIEGAAMPDGIYALGGKAVRVANGTASFEDGTLAGSVLTMNRAFANILQFAGISLTHAARYAAANALRQLGLSHRAGSLTIGQDADLAIMQPNGDVCWTIIGGRIAFSR